ncbi:TetR/AcrR family transcriptional regulator [Pedococcus sp. NPDC057267]|uniref:TetR/AcrR family transcriptional regulator n=1 Tax=Pedococcus sp. NPDC057267 TaxID=3346077 RepID=UPI00362DA156
MSQVPVPLLAAPPVERRDAARNREALLVATRRLIEHCGVEAVTMEAVAQAAGVGKGTVFRRFESRAGLMAAMLDFREQEFQGRVLSGPPPLGPGAPAMERLLAFGRERLAYNVEAARLIEAAGRVGRSAAGPRSFSVLHLAHLLGELGVEGNRGFLAHALLAPLEAVALDRAGGTEALDDLPLGEIARAWADLAHRVVTGAPAPA